MTYQIVEAVILTLTRTEPELAADVHENGIMMIGGGSLLTGIDEVLSAAADYRLPMPRTPCSVSPSARAALEDSIYSQAMAER